MYCKACGKELHPDTEICMGCGVPVGKGSSFCPNCGGAVEKDAVICVHCGKTLQEPKPEIPKDAKSRVVAGILGIFLGAFGVHNFYLKRTGRAVIQLLLGGFFVIAYMVTVTDMILSLIMMQVTVGQFAAGAVVTTVGAFCMIISTVWSFVEAILLLCGSTKVDGRGRPFRD